MEDKDCCNSLRRSCTYILYLYGACHLLLAFNILHANSTIPAQSTCIFNGFTDLEWWHAQFTSYHRGWVFWISMEAVPVRGITFVRLGTSFMWPTLMSRPRSWPRPLPSMWWSTSWSSVSSIQWLGWQKELVSQLLVASSSHNLSFV